MYKSKVQAVIFDSDGTLLNSFEMILAAYRHVAATHGLRPPTAEEVRVQLGKSLPDIYRTFYPDQDIDKLVHTNSEFVAANAMRSEAYDGLEDMLRTLHDDLHLELGIVTGGNRKIHDLLAYHKIAHYFSSVVHCERGVKAKPDPEGVHLVAKECGVATAAAVMVGDTVADIIAGKRAGVRTMIAVTHGFGSREGLEAAGADHIVDSLAEVVRTIKEL